MAMEAERDEITYLGNQEGVGGLVDSNQSNASAEVLEDEEDIFKRVLSRQPTTKYRESSIGRSLTSALSHFLEVSKISPELYEKTLRQFDRTMLHALCQRLSCRVSFKAAKLRSYKYMDGVWNFELDHVEFREYNSFANVPRVKIIAFDGKAPDQQRMVGGKRRCGYYGGNGGDTKGTRDE